MIKHIREAMNLSQQDFADRLGVSFSTVNRWENGKSKPTKLAQNSVLELVKASGIDARAETLRLKGISMANDICRAHRRDGLFFDEILKQAKEA